MSVFTWLSIGVVELIIYNITNQGYHKNKLLKIKSTLNLRVHNKCAIILSFNFHPHTFILAKLNNLEQQDLPLA